MTNLLLQASVGPCNVPEPSSWKIVEHSKWARFVSFKHSCFLCFLCYYYASLFYVSALIWNSGFVTPVHAFILLFSHEYCTVVCLCVLMLYLKLYLQYALVHFSPILLQNIVSSSSFLCSWNQLGNMSSTEAMRLFVKILEVIQIIFVDIYSLVKCNILSEIFVFLMCRKKIPVGIQEHLTLLQSL